MTDSVRETIIKAFVLRTGALSTNPIERCRRSAPADREPFFSIWDGPSSLVESLYGVERKQMQIGVECGFVTNDASVEANAMLALIEQLFMSGDRSYGDLIHRLGWVNSQINYPDDGSLVVTVRVTYEVEFAHPIGDPYTIAN